MTNQTQERDLDQILTDARRQAPSGDVSGAQFYLEQAREYAGKVGIDITERVTKVKDYIKTSWKWTKRAYLVAFLATTLHVGYDFCTSNLPRIERGETTQYLQLRRYKAKVGEEEKNLTLAGEIHWYTREENELAKKLVDEHEHFAAETGEELDMSVGNVLYGIGLSIPVTINGTFHRLGSGRWYDSIDEIAEEKGHKVHALEKDQLMHLSLGEKAELFGRSYLGMLWAPLSYYEGKNEEPYSASKFADFKYKESWLCRNPYLN